MKFSLMKKQKTPSLKEFLGSKKPPHEKFFEGLDTHLPYRYQV